MKERRWLVYSAGLAALSFGAAGGTIGRVRGWDAVSGLDWLSTPLCLLSLGLAGYVAMRSVSQPENPDRRLWVLLFAATGVALSCMGGFCGSESAVYFFDGPSLSGLFSFYQLSIPTLIGWVGGPTCVVVAMALGGRNSLTKLAAAFAYWFSFVPAAWLAVFPFWLTGARFVKGKIVFVS